MTSNFPSISCSFGTPINENKAQVKLVQISSPFGPRLLSIEHSDEMCNRRTLLFGVGRKSASKNDYRIILFAQAHVMILLSSLSLG
jgi:hypothetical protein